MLKSWGWVGWGGVVAHVIIESAPVPIGLGFRFWTGLGLGLGLWGLDSGLGLDNNVTNSTPIPPPYLELISLNFSPK